MRPEYFERFAWAIPWAFHDALDLCRFERGDTLYDHAAAYGPDWPAAMMVTETWIQVRFPEQVLGGLLSEEVRSTFAANWRSEIRLDLYRKLERIQENLVTTQGRLYTALWSGDLGYLDAESPDPEPPVGWKAVLKSLNFTVSSVKRRWPNERVFVMPYDAVSPVTIGKAKGVSTALRPYLTEDPAFLSPADAGLPSPESTAPTVYVSAFPVRGLTAEALEELIKDVLYQPNPEAKNPRFRLGAHGRVC